MKYCGSNCPKMGGKGEGGIIIDSQVSSTENDVSYQGRQKRKFRIRNHESFSFEHIEFVLSRGQLCGGV